ncbi:MAG: hypothetical protein IPP99_17775 [Chitinophagaceae bacterium]|nr:hypothetical protein [Chitinophagaceae bacterium]
MKQQLKAGDSAHGYNRIRLQQLIDGVVGNSLPAAMQHGSMVCNEVGKGVCLHRVSETFTSLVEEILDAVIDNSKKGDIHIRASRQHQRLILQITEKIITMALHWPGGLAFWRRPSAAWGEVWISETPDNWKPLFP